MDKIGECTSYQFTQTVSDAEFKKAWDTYVANSIKAYEDFINDTTLCATHGRTIQTIDGQVIVEPKDVESFETKDSIWFLNELGKKRWNQGYSINSDYCISGGMHKNVLKLFKD